MSCRTNDSSEQSASEFDSLTKTMDWMLDSAHFDMLTSNPIPLTDGYESVEELLRTALRGFEEQDTALLQRLLVTKSEYLEIIYPELGKHWPSARDMREEVQSFFWQNQYNSSMAGLLRRLKNFKERRLALIAFEFSDGVETYPSYKLHTGTRLQIRTETGDTISFTAIGSIVEKDNRYKLLSYRDLE